MQVRTRPITASLFTDKEGILCKPVTYFITLDNTTENTYISLALKSCGLADSLLHVYMMELTWVAALHTICTACRSGIQGQPNPMLLERWCCDYRASITNVL